MRGQLQDLIDLGKEERPKINWPGIPDADQQIEDQQADISEGDLRAIFDNLMEKIGPLANSVMQIKSLVEVNIGYLDTVQTGVLVRLLTSSNLAGYIKLESLSLKNEGLERINLGSSRANLIGTNLSGANLHRANLIEANLIEANLSEAQFDDATQWPEGFDPVAAGAIKIEDDEQ